MNEEEDTTTPEHTVLFENKWYMVCATVFDFPVKSHGGEYASGYSVINKVTGMTEVNTPQLPDAIAAAEQLDLAMEEEPWKWARLQSESQVVNPDGSTKEPPPDEEVH